MTHRFVEAAQQAGFRYSADLNGAEPEGVGYSQMTRVGKYRRSTARTYLKRARGLGGVLIETDAQETALAMEGRPCTVVRFPHLGTDRAVDAGRDVIRWGGAVHSPPLTAENRRV